MRIRFGAAMTVAVLLVAGALSAVAHAASAARPGVVAAAARPAGVAAVPRPDHIVVVVEENHSGTEIVGSPSAPYITSLAHDNANLTASYAVTHPSQPNYVALFSGSTNGLTDDSCPHSFSTPSLGGELLDAKLGFVGYSEGLPSAGYTGCGSGYYARKHNPWSDFPAIPGSSNQPFTAFPTDYATLPAVSFVIPNLQDDMHDGTVAQGDTWLQTGMSGYVSWAKQHNSLFVLTFDEDDNTAANRIPTIFAGQHVVPGSYPETVNHYNVLRTIEDAYGLAPIGASATSAPILDVWAASATGTPFVSDTFARTVRNGLGSAQVGGAWSTVGSPLSFSVAPGAAAFRFGTAGSQLAAFLPAVARTDADVLAAVHVDKVPVGGPVYLMVSGRRVSSGNEYQAKLVINADRSVTVRVSRLVANAETALSGPVKVAGLVYAPGMVLDVRLQVTGTSPTTVRARTWAASGAQPSAWQVTGADSTAALQVAGSLGLVGYLSSAATGAPVAVSFTTLTAEPSTAA